jgi:flagellar basal body-associated protein FliL
MKTKMKFNLTKILSSVNNKLAILTEDEVQLFLNEDNSIIVLMGKVTYLLNIKKLKTALKVINFEKYHKNETEDLVTELLSKHIVNQLMTSSGKMMFSQIKLTDLGLNKKQINNDEFTTF